MRVPLGHLGQHSAIKLLIFDCQEVFQQWGHIEPIVRHLMSAVVGVSVFRISKKNSKMGTKSPCFASRQEVGPTI